MKLIDGQAMIDRVEDLYKRGQVDMNYFHIVREAVQMERRVEAIPVVRCKDCVFGHVTQAMSGRDRIDCCNDNSASGTVKYLLPFDWYCPDGERRE